MRTKLGRRAWTCRVIHDTLVHCNSVRIFFRSVLNCGCLFSRETNQFQNGPVPEGNGPCSVLNVFVFCEDTSLRSDTWNFCVFFKAAFSSASFAAGSLSTFSGFSCTMRVQPRNGGTLVGTDRRTQL